jgi:hypothetical protein
MKERPPGGDPGGQGDGKAPVSCCPQDTTNTLPETTPRCDSSLDALAREESVLRALANLLAAALPDRSADAQAALDALAAAYAAQGVVRAILTSDAVRRAVEGEGSQS